MTAALLRRAAHRIFGAALQAVDPAEAVRRHAVRDGDRLSAGGLCISLDAIERIYVVGAGKAAVPMAQAVEAIVGDRVADGVAVVPHGTPLPAARIRFLQAGHPIPDEASLRGAQAILSIVSAAGPRDLVIAVISGGASALLTLPVVGLGLHEKQEMTRQLLASGATVREMNVVRKHLSGIKGGRLAAAACPARLVGLILSDVVGDPIDAVASGPTAPDPSTYADALAVIERYGLDRTAPQAVLRHLRSGVRGEVPETPKPDDPLVRKTANRVVGNNLDALRGAAEAARALGFDCIVLSSSIEGETREVAGVHAAVAREIRASAHPLPPPACVISGGETTVTLRGRGRGGRNQEFALAAALAIDGVRDVAVFSAGTDGIDGATEAAGAIADGDTVRRARALGLDPVRLLDENDSHRVFERLGDLVVTGPTQTNVMDVRLVLVGGNRRDGPESMAS
jgi:glycerate 2-kinase